MNNLPLLSDYFYRKYFNHILGKNSAMKFFLTLSLVVCVFAQHQAQNYQETLENIAEEQQLIGMSVIVMCNGAISDRFYYGLADIDREIAVSDQTYFRIASISKTVTASALMKLFENDNFALEDNINNYLDFNIQNPNYPDDSITFGMLLSHTSGLVDGSGYSSFLSSTYNETPPPHISELLTIGGSYYTNDMWLNAVPGTYFSYSNINFGLIATLIEQISGQRFDRFVRDSILTPLNISGSFNIDHLPDINRVAVLYRNAVPQADHYQGTPPEPFDSTSYTIGSNGLVFAPQGGLRITAEELMHFMSMHANEGQWENIEILQKATIDLMHKPTWTYNGSNGNNYYNLFNQWGLGMQITTNTANGDIVLPETTMIGHPGEAYGLISDMYFEKAKQFGIIFLTNGYYSGGYNFGDSTAFYVPEEQVFGTVAEYQFPICDTTTSAAAMLNNKIEDPFFVNQQSQTIHFKVNNPTGMIYIYSLGGNIVHKGQINKKQQPLPELPAGLYIIHWKNGTHSFTQKFIESH